MNILRRTILYLVAAALCVGCATLLSDFVQPGVILVSVTPRNWSSINPEFEILLRVTNPNRAPLKIAGLTYTIHLEGIKVIAGVANELPEIAAYGENDVKINAIADLFGGLGLLAGLMAEPRDQIGFEFNAQIDVGSFYPMVKINKSGTILFQ